MPHYFANSIVDNIATFTLDDEHHIVDVLRMKKNDEINIAFQGVGYVGKIVNEKPLKVQILKENNLNTELKNEVTLFYCPIKGDKFDLVLQKACEIGVSSIYLVISERTVVRFDKNSISKKIQRFQKIIDSSASQCMRLKKPIIKGIININEIDKGILCKYNFLANEYVNQSSKPPIDLFSNIQPNSSISIFVGPEGGFSLNEINFLEKLGFVSISLGKRILKSDTAVIYLLSVLSFLLECNDDNL